MNQPESQRLPCKKRGMKLVNAVKRSARTAHKGVPPKYTRDLEGKDLQDNDMKDGSAKTLLRAVNVSRSYPDGTGKTFYAVKGASLSIVEHTLTVIKGRSGSGKTTLLNMMSTLEEPDSGEIYHAFGANHSTACNGAAGDAFGAGSSAVRSETVDLGEKPYSSENTGQKEGLRRLKMGFVFQSIALIPVFTAYENVEFSLRMAGVKKRRERVEELLAMMGLSERMHHMPAQLSGGEQQRVAIARAVAHHPAVLFADEPTGALDTDTGLQVMDFFQRLIKEEELTVVMTTHDPRLMAMGDRLYEMSDGHLQEVTKGT